MAEEEIIARIGQGYRFRPATQVGLMLILSVIGVWGIYEGFSRLWPPFNELETIITMSIIYVALLYPVVVKLETRAANILSFGFFGAALVATVYWLITHVQFTRDPVAIALYVMFMEIVSMELFHHLCEAYVFYERDWRSYLIVGILSAGFFACMWMLLGPQGYGLGSIAIVLAVVLTMMFAWAVLPEKPI